MCSKGIQQQRDDLQKPEHVLKIFGCYVISDHARKNDITKVRITPEIA